MKQLLGNTDGEVPSTTLGDADVFSVAISEGGMGIVSSSGIGYGSEEFEESELGYSLGLEGGSEMRSSYDMLYENSYETIKDRSLVESLRVDDGIEVGPCDGMSVGNVSGKLKRYPL